MSESILLIPDDRRQAERHKAKCEACSQGDLSLLDVKADAEGAATSLTLFGSTHDLSATGLALVIPCVAIDKQFCDEKDRSLQVNLYLPSGSVRMNVAPVRCQALDEEEPLKGYLIGAQIVEMEENDRSCLIRYLQAIE